MLIGSIMFILLIYPIIEKQLTTILDGIGVDSMKTGMLGSALP